MYFEEGVCVILQVVCPSFFFLYNCTTFENYISYNDPVLFAIQKTNKQTKPSLPPSNHPEGIKVPERRPIQDGFYSGRNKKQKDEKKQ